MELFALPKAATDGVFAEVAFGKHAKQCSDLHVEKITSCQGRSDISGRVGGWPVEAIDRGKGDVNLVL